MLEYYGRFTVEQKDHSFSHTADFANCKEQAEQQTGAIMLDFQKEPQKAAESPCILAETECKDSANPLISQREPGEIALEDTPAIATPDSAENSEIRHESKQSKGHISNFANARLY